MTTAELGEKVKTTEFRCHPYPGLYIVFDGTGGTGKDEVSKAVQARIQDLLPEVEVLWTHEPGGTPYAEELRKRLKTEELPLEEQIELFAQAREDSLPSVVQPVLQRGGVVLSVRNAFSSLAYQGFGGGAGIERVLARNRLFVEKFIPNVAVCIERNLDVALAQAQTEYDRRDVFDEDLGLNLRIQQGYRKLKEMFEHVCDWIWIDNLDDSLSLEQTTEIVWGQLLPKVDNWWRNYR